MLGLIDNSTVEQLQGKLPQVPPDKLKPALDKLFIDGYINFGAAAAAPAPPIAGPDFAQFINRPVKEPTIQKCGRRRRRCRESGPRRRPAITFTSSTGPPSACRRTPAANKHTVLIIDADQDNSLVVARALLLAKFETRAAVRQDEIVAALNQQPPADVIAMDMVLPDVIGLELLGRLREHPTYKSVPIIVMTAKVEHDDIVAALAYGASGYMTKPFKPEALVDSVQAVLGL